MTMATFSGSTFSTVGITGYQPMIPPKEEVLIGRVKGGRPSGEGYHGGYYTGDVAVYVGRKGSTCGRSCYLLRKDNQEVTDPTDLMVIICQGYVIERSEVVPFENAKDKHHFIEKFSTVLTREQFLQLTGEDDGDAN